MQQKKMFIARTNRYYLGLLKSCIGWQITSDEWYDTTARRILHMQRALLLLAGPDLKWNPKTHDDNPNRFHEPLPSGPYSGKSVDRTKFEERATPSDRKDFELNSRSKSLKI